MESTIGMMMREARRKQKLTLRDLSSKTGVDFSLLSKYENGIINPPREKIRLIAEALNLTEDSLRSKTQVLDIDSLLHRRPDFNSLEEDQLIVSNSAANRAVLEAADGRCELCGQRFPDGEIFLEAHHVIWLRDGGAPTVDNTVALCPNCHKRIHLYRDPRDTDKLLEAIHSRTNKKD